MIDVHQTGVFYDMKAAAPELLKVGNAAIVNISSLYGLIPSPNALSYHASKVAVRVMGKGAALEFAKKGIRVNIMLPGQVLSPILVAKRHLARPAPVKICLDSILNFR